MTVSIEQVTLTSASGEKATVTEVMVPGTFDGSRLTPARSHNLPDMRDQISVSCCQSQPAAHSDADAPPDDNNI